MKLSQGRRLGILITGDLVVMALVTILGFAAHGEVGSAGARMLSTYLPLIAAWAMVAPFLRVYDLGLASRVGDLWRPLYAAILMAPMAAFLRSVMLGFVLIMPIFVVVMAGVSALSILAWRTICWITFSRSQASYE